MTPALEAALDYIRRGWSVFPLASGTKQPAIPWVDYQTRRMGPAEAKRLWTQLPDAGVAIVTGAISGLVVIDVDPRNGGDIEEVEHRLNGYGYPIVAKTGGGGRHIFCQHHEGGRIPCGKTILPGVDRKGDGGYIVAPPSVHPSGGVYEWIANPSQANLIRLPGWVLEFPASTGPAPGEDARGPWVSETLLHPEQCMPGGQEDVLTKLAWWASKHLPSPDIAFSVLMQWASRLPLGNTRDPWTESHIMDRLDRAYEKRALEPGAVAGIVEDRKVERVAWAEDATSYPPFVRAADLEFPEQDWVVEDFAAPGAFTEIVGKVKKGKSTLVYQLIQAVMSGADFLGRKTIKSPAVVLTEQTGTSLGKTLERAGIRKSSDLYLLRKADMQPLGGWAKSVGAATDLCIRTGAKLLVVDTLMRLAGLGGDADNKSGAVKILDAFDRAKQAGIACVFVRHARKGVQGGIDDIADMARGSSAITGDMDIIIRLVPEPDDLRVLSWESRITDDPEDIYLKYTNGLYAITDEPPSARERDQMERLRQYREALEELGDEASIRQLAERLEWSTSTVHRYQKIHTAQTHGPGVGPIEDDLD